MEAVASDVLNQYTLTYDSAAAVVPSRKLSVSTKRRGVTVRAPEKIAQ